MSLLTPAGFQEKIKSTAKKCGGITELSRRIGVPYRTVQNWACGWRVPDLRRLHEVLELCEKAEREADALAESKGGKP